MNHVLLENMGEYYEKNLLSKRLFFRNIFFAARTQGRALSVLESGNEHTRVLMRHVLLENMGNK